MPNALVSYLKLFHDIPSDDEPVIVAATEIRHYKDGDYLFRADKICREMFFVCHGVLRIMNVNENGNEVTHFFVNENRFCSILNSFNNHTIADQNIIAACDVEVLALTRAGLDQLYAQLPYLQNLITQITHQSLLDKINVSNAYRGQDSTARYNTFMMRQADIALRVSLTDVASYLGITPQSLSRIRKNIK